MRAHEARGVGEKASRAEGVAELPQGQQAQGTLEGLTRYCQAEKASGKQMEEGGQSSPQEESLHPSPITKRSQKTSSDMIEWAFLKALASGEIGTWGR